MSRKNKTCKTCVYRDECLNSLSKNYNCSDYKYGDPESLIDYERDLMEQEEFNINNNEQNDEDDNE